MKIVNHLFLEALKSFGRDATIEYKFHPTRRWRFDYCLPKLKIAVEVEGGIFTRGRHVRPMGFIRDMEKYNEATKMGFKVLRYQPDELLNAIADIKDIVSGPN